MAHTAIKIASAAACSLLLTACTLFGAKSDYEQAQETRPLEIPPDLDSPSANNSMLVPAAPASGGDSAALASPQSIEAGEASSLKLGDSVSGAFKRVGLALERSGVAEIVARDESAATITVSGSSSTEPTAKPGFFKRMFSSDDKATAAVKVTRVVRIVADGSGCLVRVENDQGEATNDELSRRVIAAIRQRLG